MYNNGCIKYVSMTSEIFNLVRIYARHFFEEKKTVDTKELLETYMLKMKYSRSSFSNIQFVARVFNLIERTDKKIIVFNPKKYIDLAKDISKRTSDKESFFYSLFFNSDITTETEARIWSKKLVALIG